MTMRWFVTDAKWFVTLEGCGWVWSWWLVKQCRLVCAVCTRQCSEWRAVNACPGGALGARGGWVLAGRVRNACRESGRHAVAAALCAHGYPLRVRTFSALRNLDVGITSAFSAGV